MCAYKHTVGNIMSAMNVVQAIEENECAACTQKYTATYP